MRLTCPNCLTEYDVPDAALAGRARTLRCAYCGYQWRREAEATMPDGTAAVTPLIDVLPLLPEASEPAAPEATVPAQRHPDIVARPAAASLRAAPRAPEPLAPVKRPSRAPLIVLLLVVVAMVMVLVAHRPIARAWPASIGVFQALGLK